MMFSLKYLQSLRWRFTRRSCSRSSSVDHFITVLLLRDVNKAGKNTRSNGLQEFSHFCWTVFCVACVSRRESCNPAADFTWHSPHQTALSLMDLGLRVCQLRYLKLWMRLMKFLWQEHANRKSLFFTNYLEQKYASASVLCGGIQFNEHIAATIKTR